MRTALMSAVVVVLAACGYEPLEGETSARPVSLLRAPECTGPGCSMTTTATVENGLAYDGCSFPITIGNVQYAPSAATKARVETLMQADFGKKHISLTYRVTGLQAEVTCGWNSTRALPEIEVLSGTLAAPTP
jgi:FlaG/FlaF family flagellin (archaellin)